MKTLIQLLHNFHNEYLGRGIGPTPEVPHDLLDKWLREAITVGCQEPTAMHLGTHGLDGYPQVRTVLFKGFHMDSDSHDPYDRLPAEKYLTFYTNYDSNKGLEINADKRVALTFFWPELYKEVRITGTAIKHWRKESREYWDSRPILSRVASLASQQSKPIDSRDDLVVKFHAANDAAWDSYTPIPDNWGGYLVRATSFEFWHGRANRLNERLKYTFDPHDGKLWSTQILQP